MSFIRYSLARVFNFNQKEDRSDLSLPLGFKVRPEGSNSGSKHNDLRTVFVSKLRGIPLKRRGEFKKYPHTNNLGSKTS
jgi:hypothetical protein